MLNRFVRWLLRDFLVVLDQRQQATAEAAGRHAADAQRALHEMAAREQPFSATLQALAGRQDSLLLELHELQHVQGRLHTLIEATRAVAGRLGEVVDLLEGGAEQLRLLADVKDAETLQRAVHGPLRRMDLLFDEVARQQEALLAELVGKRGELEALVARLQAPGAP